MRRTILAAAVGACALSAPDRAAEPIRDNSFLVEEAFNQERGVVQHIGSWTRLRESDAWAMTFTQEWPAPGVRHQLSYTLRALGGEVASSGLGDVLLNYRYQALGASGGPLAFAPRISVVLPTGDEAEGRGDGAFGLQANLPFSYEREAVALHANLGWFHTPDAENPLGEQADRSGWSAAASAIWLARPRFNVLLEAAYTRSEDVVGPAITARDSEAFVSPGIRWAHDRRSGLQIVPGLAVPVGVGSSSGEEGILLYVSFEHPFHRGR